MSNLESELRELGLSDLEAKIYLQLVKTGKNTILEISRALSLNRSTTHLNVEKLIQMGLVTQLNMGSRRVVVAEPPEKLMVIIEAERWKIKRKEEGLNNIISSIYDSIADTKRNTMSYVKFYEGKKEVSKLYEIALSAKNISGYTHSMQTIITFPENQERVVDALESGTSIRDLHEQSFSSGEFQKLAKRYKNYRVKFFPKEYKVLNFDYMIHDDCITQVSTVEDDIFAIVINHPKLVENARTMFDMLWNLLPE